MQNTKSIQLGNMRRLRTFLVKIIKDPYWKWNWESKIALNEVVQLLENKIKQHEK